MESDENTAAIRGRCDSNDREATFYLDMLHYENWKGEIIKIHCCEDTNFR